MRARVRVIRGIKIIDGTSHCDKCKKRYIKEFLIVTCMNSRSGKYCFSCWGKHRLRHGASVPKRSRNGNKELRNPQLRANSAIERKRVY